MSTITKHKNNFMKYRYLLKELVVKNIKLQYRNSVLGMFWTFLQPLLTMVVLSIVFNNLFGRDSSKVVNYSVYLLSGRLLYEFFTQSTKRAMRSIRSNASIIKKVYVPKYIYPLSQALSTFVTFLISLSVLAVVILFFNIIGKDPVPITFNIFYAIIPIIILFVFSLGVGMLLGTLNVFFKDIENFYDVFTLLLFYLTPIVYTVDRLGFENGSWQSIMLKLNPLYGIIEMFRAAVLHGDKFLAYFSTNELIYTSVVALVAFVIGFAVFYKNQDKFILHI
ncbi:MAG: ABC transporter permease [Acutalibacteraceae bacterium]|nr:ABC transporter permease [Acutalibacteraceae bacterium]